MDQRVCRSHGRNNSPSQPLKAITVAQAKRSALVPVQDITRAILVLRGQRVLLDADLQPSMTSPPKR
jgi:hypothetical protein